MQVAGIVGRAELMSALCFFLTMFCYMRACGDDCSWWKEACWLVLTILLVGAALLFKEQGITAMVGITITVKPPNKGPEIVLCPLSEVENVLWKA